MTANATAIALCGKPAPFGAWILALVHPHPRLPHAFQLVGGRGDPMPSSELVLAGQDDEHACYLVPSEAVRRQATALGGAYWIGSDAWNLLTRAAGETKLLEAIGPGFSIHPHRNGRLLVGDLTATLLAAVIRLSALLVDAVPAQAEPSARLDMACLSLTLYPHSLPAWRLRYAVCETDEERDAIQREFGQLNPMMKETRLDETRGT